MADDMDAMMADGLLRTVRESARLLYGENQVYPCDDVKRMMTDVERLRAALQDIVVDSFSVYAIQVARAALNPAKD